MGILEWGIIAGALVFVLVCVFILAAVLLTRAMRSKGKAPRPQPNITTYAAPLQPQRSSMFDALDAGGPGAQAKIEGAMVDYAVREKLRQFSEATAPLMTAPAPVPNPPTP